MNILTDLLDLFLHLDEHLTVVTQTYGSLTYFFLFLVIFMETGLVVTPFLPGDSLLFAAGALAALPGTGLNVGLLFVLLFAAAVIGDTVNYGIGKAIGPRVFEQNYRFLKREYLERTQAFYAKHGGKTIILARFVPIVRTFAPFVAGVGTMRYRQFILFNIMGGFLWTLLFIFGGYFFGNIPIVKENFELVIIGIILISLLPMVIEWLRGRKQTPASSLSQS
jgi:membrane-associated protein